MGEATKRRIAYQPALDGLRGVAVIAVVAYHAGVEPLRGGFLGVSTFFTLSGFLITALLVREHEAEGSISLRSFWNRRVRRLLPAAIVTLAATVVLVAVIGDDSQLSRLRGDALASLLHFSNWRFVAAGDDYGALFDSPSYFRHFWSLAVEEQYYLLMPVLIAGALRLAGGVTRRFRIGVGMALAATAAWPVVLLAAGASTDRIYFGTDGRLGELGIGAALALWWTTRSDATVSPRTTRVLDGAAVLALALMAAAWSTAHPGDRLLYQGGLATHAVLTALVIVAVVNPAGRLRMALGARPLRAVGLVSYGVYLVHWPILLWIDHVTDLGPWSRFALGLASSILVAAALHVAVERPLRRGTAVGLPLWTAVPATAMVAMLIVSVSAWRSPANEPIDFAAAQSRLDELTRGPVTSAPVVPSPPSASDGADPAPAVGAAIEEAPDERPVAHIAAFGDSTALMTGLGLADWASSHPDRLRVIQGDAKLGCGLLTGGTRRVEGRTISVPASCDNWLGDWLSALDTHQPVDVGGDRITLDAAVIQLGAWEIVDYRPAADQSFTSVLDPAHADRLQEQLESTIDALRERADRVILIAHPDVGEARLQTLPTGRSYPEYDPARSARWREILAEVAQRSDVEIIDLASHIEALGSDDLRVRPDGVHFSPQSAREIAEWLAPVLIEHTNPT